MVLLFQRYERVNVTTFCMLMSCICGKCSTRQGVHRKEVEKGERRV